MTTKIFPENICYKVSVAENYEKKDVGIATRVPESTKRLLEEIAYDHDRKVGYVIRELLGRGLALYEIDGRLKDVARASVRAAAEVNLAPVVAAIPSADEVGKIQHEIGERKKLPVLKGKVK